MLQDLSYELAAGQIVDQRFRIEAPLGMGGIGTVYRARELDSGDNVALKVLHEDLGDQGESRLRFEREARALAALRNPNIVPIRGFGVDGGRPYLVMELLPGRTLTEIIAKESPLDPARALGLARQIIEAVAFIHEAGIIHRDLKSPNVLVERTEDGSEHARVLDFGFAKFFDKAKWHDEQTLTARGAVFGTLQYMAPEQAMGAKVNARADVYALGILLFELWTGSRPFRSDDRQELFEMHVAAKVPDLQELRSDVRAPRGLDRVIQTALAKDPRKRFEDARAMLAALDSVQLQGSHAPGHRTPGVVLTAIAVIAAGVAMLLWARG